MANFPEAAPLGNSPPEGESKSPFVILVGGKFNASVPDELPPTKSLKWRFGSPSRGELSSQDHSLETHFTTPNGE